MLSAIAEVDLVVRLQKWAFCRKSGGRKQFATVGQYALDGGDLYALDDYIHPTVFEPDEFDELLRRVRTVLVPRLKSDRTAGNSIIAPTTLRTAHVSRF